MESHEKNILKLIPFLIPLIVGILVYYLAAFIPVTHINLISLLINISATLISITVIYVFHNIFKEYSDKKLNRALFDYAKSRIDNEILGILMQLQKMICPFDKIDRTFNGVISLLHLSKQDLLKQISNIELLGYQIFKKWDVSLINIEKVMENPYTLKYLTNEQIISLIDILRKVEDLNAMYLYGKKDMFKNTNKSSAEYTIIPPYQSNFPDRSMLLKKIKNKKDTGIVVDFGDISHNDLKNALNLFKVKKVEEYSQNINELLEAIRCWLHLTGNTFFIILKDKRIWDQKEKRFLYSSCIARGVHSTKSS